MAALFKETVSRHDLTGLPGMIAYVTRAAKFSLLLHGSDFSVMTEFYVKVQPDSGEQAVKNSSTITEVRLESAAEQGRANTELLNLMQEILGDKVGIISGHQSRRKKLKTGLEGREVEKRLEQYGEDSTEKQ